MESIWEYWTTLWVLGGKLNWKLSSKWLKPCTHRSPDGKTAWSSRLDRVCLGWCCFDCSWLSEWFLSGSSSVVQFYVKITGKRCLSCRVGLAGFLFNWNHIEVYSLEIVSGCCVITAALLHFINSLIVLYFNSWDKGASLHLIFWHSRVEFHPVWNSKNKITRIRIRKIIPDELSLIPLILTKRLCHS